MSFNWKVYGLLNPDLIRAGFKTPEKLHRHYITHCKNDKRLSSVYELYPDFNPISYQRINPDLTKMSISDLEVHWIKNGRHEKREYLDNKSTGIISSVPNNFNWQVYRDLNPDLIKAGINTPDKVCKHYKNHCKVDKRISSVYELYPDFDPISYRSMNPDLNKMSILDLELHWIKNGRHEKREYLNVKKDKNTYTGGNIYRNTDNIFYNDLDNQPNVSGYKTIISLSVIPNRLLTADFDCVVDSLYNQRIKAYKIVVNLCHNYRRQFDYDKEQVQNKINYLTEKYDNLIFNYSEDYGPITKILGLYNSNIVLDEQDRVIVVDDDWIMNNNMTYYYEYVYQLYNSDCVFINERDIIDWSNFSNMPQTQIFYDNYQNFAYGWLSFSMKYKFIKDLYDFYNKYVTLDESLWKHDDLLITLFYKISKLYACGMNLYFYDKNNILKIDKDFALRNGEINTQLIRKNLEIKLLTHFGYRYTEIKNHIYIINEINNVTTTSIPDKIRQRELLYCVNGIDYDPKINDFHNKHIDIKYFNSNTMVLTITYFNNINVNDILYLNNNKFYIHNNEYSKKVSYFVCTHNTITKIDNSYDLTVFQKYNNTNVSLNMFYSINTILANTPKMKYEYYTDEDMISYLKSKNNFYDKIINKLKPGAYKADFFRLVKLYYEGGIYFDIKMILYTHLDNIILSKYDKMFVRDISGGIYNAFLYCKEAYNLQIKNTLIKLILNVINENYSTDPLSITGPNIMKDIITDNVFMKNMMISDDWKEAITVYDNMLVIKNAYPGYYEENNYLKTNHYSVLWNNRDVFLPLDYSNIYNKINYISGILWINLDRSGDRRTYMERLLSNINIPNTRISAVDGKQDITSMYNINTRNMTKYEIGCTLSHIKAINTINTEEGEYFMILEDDVSLNNLVFFKNTLESIIKNSPEFDILLLKHVYDKELDTYTNWNNEYNKGAENHIACTASYIISKSGINRIKNICKYSNNYFNFSVQNLDVADKFIYNTCNTWVYKYNFIDNLNIDSEIHSDHIQWHKTTSDISKNVIIRDSIQNII